MSKGIAARAAGFVPWRLSEWFANLPGNRYSRRVALLKLALPAIGGTLLLLVVAWPRIAPLLDRMRFAAIDLREARELRMVNPRYAGTDRTGRPFVVTASLGRQVPGRDDVMSLEAPRADMKAHSGAAIVITSDSAVYQSQSQLLDMFGNVTVVHENGTKFVTDSARLDAVNNAGEGHSPVEGHGPSGDVTAQGFRLIDKGDIIVFTGQSAMLLRSANQAADKPGASAPAALPAPVAQAAAQIAAKAEPASAASAAPPSKKKPPPQHSAKAAPHHPAAKKPG
jgi:lipopolysaccharide export system protein LptC